jgi:hypothetical protein
MNITVVNAHRRTVFRTATIAWANDPSKRPTRPVGRRRRSTKIDVTRHARELCLSIGARVRCRYSIIVTWDPRATVDPQPVTSGRSKGREREVSKIKVV